MHAQITSARPKTGVWYLAMAGILWGTGGFTGTLLARVTGLTSLPVAAYRLLIGGTLLVLLLAATRTPLPRTRAAWKRILVVAGLSALYQSSYFAAVSLSSVSIATLVTIGACPALVMLGERLTGRRQLTRRMVLVLVLASLGLVLIIGQPSANTSSLSVILSVALSLLSAAGFAVLTLVSATPVPNLNALTTTGLGFTLGGIILAAVAFPALEFKPTLTAVVILVALGLIPTATAYPLYFQGLRTVPAGTAAVMALLEPLTGATLGVVFLGDRLTVPAVAGGVLLIAAVLRAIDY